MPGDPPLRVLLADDEKTIAVTLADDLRAAGHQVTVAQDGREAADALTRERYDVLISDIRMPGLTGLELLEKVKAETPDTDVILITAWATVEAAVEAMRAGARTYIQKPFLNEKVVSEVENLAQLRKLRAENVQLRTELENWRERSSMGAIVGRSAQMQDIFHQVETIAESDVNILVEGESGTGKELLAKAIHQTSRRKGGALVTLHCAQFPTTLLEDEIFGHERGAYTDARDRKIGRFERAQGGTLFLDDIDDMSPETQVKLLRVIQERTFERLGGTEPIKVDVRVIAATKVDLAVAVQEQKFRDDLFYRLNVVKLKLPPLRERADDIPLLSEALVQRYGKDREFRIAPEVMQAMMSYPWPGNVRELENAIERAIALAGNHKFLRREHLIQPGPQHAKVLAQLKDLRPIGEVLKEVEAAHIRNVLRSTDGHKAQAAEILGISRKSLWEKMKEHGIE